MRRLSFRDVSAHRAVLYGLAALWIAFFHMDYAVPAKGWLYPVRALQEFGACGVEIFVLLTGAGLYRSLKRDPDVGRFYRKRMARVLIVSVIMYGMTAQGIGKWMSAALFAPFWFGVQTLWYVPFILTMYLLYPAVYALQRRAPRAMWGLLALSVLGALAGSMVQNGWTGVCMRGVARIPAFLVGCMLAPRFDRGEEIPRWAAPGALALAAAWYLVWRRLPMATYFTRSMFFLFLSVFLILAAVRLCTFCRGGLPGFVYRLLAFCGGCSLEIYLLYSRVSIMMGTMPGHQSGAVGLLQVELLSLFITVILSSLLVKLSGHLVREFTAIELPEKRSEG